MEKKYELCIEYEGTKEGAIEFAKEIQSEFDCKIVINEVDDDGNVVEGMIDT